MVTESVNGPLPLIRCGQAGGRSDSSKFAVAVWKDTRGVHHKVLLRIEGCSSKVGGRDAGSATRTVACTAYSDGCVAGFESGLSQ